MRITHAFVSAKSDGGDTSVVRPSDWNAEHVGGMSFSGTWSAAAAYAVGDVVAAANGGIFVCTAAHTDHAPPNASYWSQVGIAAGCGTRLGDNGTYVGATLSLGRIGSNYNLELVGVSNGITAFAVWGGSSNMLWTSRANYFDIQTNSSGKGVGITSPGGVLYIHSTGDVSIGGTPGSPVTPNAKLDVRGSARVGDGTTNYVGISATGDVTFAGSAGFYPRMLSQSEQPAAGTGSTQLDTGELCIWTDTDDSKCYLCFNHGGTIKKVELT